MGGRGLFIDFSETLCVLDKKNDNHVIDENLIPMLRTLKTQVDPDDPTKTIPTQIVILTTDTEEFVREKVQQILGDRAEEFLNLIDFIVQETNKPEFIKNFAGAMGLEEVIFLDDAHTNVELYNYVREQINATSQSTTPVTPGYVTTALEQSFPGLASLAGIVVPALPGTVKLEKDELDDSLRSDFDALSLSQMSMNSEHEQVDAGTMRFFKAVPHKDPKLMDLELDEASKKNKSPK